MTYPKVEQAEQAKKDAAETKNKIFRTYIESDSFDEFMIKISVIGEAKNDSVILLKDFFEWKNSGNKLYRLKHFAALGCVSAAIMAVLGLTWSIIGLIWSLPVIAGIVGIFCIIKNCQLSTFSEIQRDLSRLYDEIESERLREQRRQAAKLTISQSPITISPGCSWNGVTVGSIFNHNDFDSTISC